VAQAVIYIHIVQVEMTSLVLLIAASVLGSWLGAGVVARWPKRKIQIGMGFALLGAAGLMLASALHFLPAAEIPWPARLAHGRGSRRQLCLRRLMNLGIGAYAPSLILFGFLGMDLKAVFPVMMVPAPSSCQPVEFASSDAAATRRVLPWAGPGWSARRAAGGVCGARAEG